MNRIYYFVAHSSISKRLMKKVLCMFCVYYECSLCFRNRDPQKSDMQRLSDAIQKVTSWGPRFSEKLYVCKRQRQDTKTVVKHIDLLLTAGIIDTSAADIADTILDHYIAGRILVSGVIGQKIKEHVKMK